MPSILPGFTFSRSAARYRDTARGQFVSRARVMTLLDQSVASAEQRLGDIVQGVFAKEIAPGYAQTMMRDELRRLHLQNAALGAGGMDRLTFREYGRAGRALRDTYARVASLTRDMEAGRVTLPQALNRIVGYAGEARVNFFQAERDAVRATGHQFEERRVLHARESCVDCVRYAGMGWQPMGTMPLPGEQSRCGVRCRCSLERREVTPEMMRERMTTRLERMMA